MDLSERRTGDGARHPWELARRDFFLRLLAQAGLFERPGRWLDVGGGDAFIAEALALRLAPGSELCVWDMAFDEATLRSLQAALPKNVSLSREAPGGVFDVALLLDVIEHVADERGFLAEIVDKLGQGARVLVSVPAWPALFGDHDRALRHHRRYAPRRCAQVLEAAGLEVTREGGVFHGLLLARAAQIYWEKLRPRAAHGVGGWGGGRVLSATITKVLKLEGSISLWAAKNGVLLPGLSYWALCQKR